MLNNIQQYQTILCTILNNVDQCTLYIIANNILQNIIWYSTLYHTQYCDIDQIIHVAILYCIQSVLYHTLYDTIYKILCLIGIIVQYSKLYSKGLNCRCYLMMPQPVANWANRKCCVNGKVESHGGALKIFFFGSESLVLVLYRERWESLLYQPSMLYTSSHGGTGRRRWQDSERLQTT